MSCTTVSNMKSNGTELKGRRVLLQIAIFLGLVMFLEAVATTRAQTLPSISGSIILNGESLDAFKVMGRQQELAEAKVVEVTGEPFKKALRVSTKSGAQSEWNAQLFTIINEPVKTGDVLLARFSMRCTESMTDEGFVGFVYEMAHPEFDKAAEVRLAAGSKWRECFVRFRAPRDFPAGEARVCLRVGYDRQTIEIGGIQVINYGKTVKLEDLPRTGVSYAGRGEDAAWRNEALARIEKIRKGDLTVTVTDASGKALADASVHVKLTKPAFGFGSCVTTEMLLDQSPDGVRYREIIEKYFNRAVFENDMKWQAVYDGISPKTDQALDWLLQHNIDVRGHNLFWCGWRWLPAALKQYENSPDELRRISAQHATDVVSHFKGKLIQWDVVNEPYTNHDLIDLLGGRSVMIDWFKLAKQADPQCKMFLNDYGILEGGPEGAHSKDFFDTIKYLKDNGAPIDGIGIQSHFAAALPPPAQVLQTLDRFSELGLPIELTELSFNLDDRDLQADYMRDFMIAAFSHPNVNGVMLWGFWEKRHWRPQGALWSADWSMRPHGRQWIDLVQNQWRTNAELHTDVQGEAKTRGFCGTYEVTVSASGKTKTVNAKLTREGEKVNVTLE
jgi:GH35 family endo-1,4-beta-xylanase